MDKRNQGQQVVDTTGDLHFRRVGKENRELWQCDGIIEEGRFRFRFTRLQPKILGPKLCI